MVSSAEFFATPLATFPGVGKRRSTDLARVGLRTVDDLLARLPFRYEDRSHFRPVAEIEIGEAATLSGELVNCRLRLARRSSFQFFEAGLRDESGVIRLVWPNQPFLARVLHAGQRVVVYGRVETFRDVIQLTSPDYEIVSEDAGDHSVHMGRIVPVYERAGSMTPRMQRQLVHAVLERLPLAVDDPLPRRLREQMGLPGRRDALIHAHFPPAGTPLASLNRMQTPAQIRLIFEEFFMFQLGLAARRREARQLEKPFRVRVDQHVREAARRLLPFRLTPDQRAAVREIVGDQQRSRPMNRLLQGDVGSGKTIVAALAALVAIENGLQVAVLAPTELLAEQHHSRFQALFAQAGHPVLRITAAVPTAERRRAAAMLSAGTPALAVGTHALLDGRLQFGRLGLVIIDEQHRFGVAQRLALGAKGQTPDVLVMTATPIPRTLALTCFGDLDVSMIRGGPPGRQGVRTIVEPDTNRAEVYARVRAELERGGQGFIVYPLIEDSPKVDLKAAAAMADHLATEVFPEFRVGLIHGRLESVSREAVMRRFAAGELDLLVATTVIEVGLDVPNASIMVVEHAERFGLAQLHQLRGRVGRGLRASTCVLLYQPPLSDESRGRLTALAETDNGFLIAERDLALRGPGDLPGTRQSGLPTLRVGDLRRDQAIMEQAWHAAREWIGKQEPEAEQLRSLAREVWLARFGLMSVG